jgi:dolichol-phosphate mannosyltransferase
VHYSVVVPTLNEVDNVDPLIARLLALPGLAAEAEIVFVDDGSTDGTAERIAGWAERAPVRLLRRAGPPDLTRAIRDGVALARHDVILVMDADLSHAPEAIPALLAPLAAGSHDMAVGSRHVAGGATVGWPLPRRLLSRLGALLAWPVSDLADPTSGFFAARRWLFDRLSPAAAGYKIALELAVAAGPAARIVELPITFRDRVAGRSKLSLRTDLLFAARLAALAGCRLSPAGLASAIAAALAAGALDALVAGLAWALGAGLPGASLAGFAAGQLAVVIGVARRPSPQPLVVRMPLAGLVALLALAMRCAVLAWAGAGFATLPLLLAAVTATLLVGWVGTTLLVETRPASDDRREPRWRTVALAVIVYLLVLRLLFVGLPQLSGNEAYYWAYSVHPSLSYLDHPPMVAWLIQLGTSLAGHSELGVRLGAPACWLIAAFFVYRLARDLLGKAVAIRALLLLSIMPFFYEAGIHMTPDAPLVACWAAALYYLMRMLVLGDRRAWLGLGIAFGFGLLSKYSIVLLALAGLAFMVVDGPARRWIRRPEPWWALGVAVFLFTPVLIWNFEHGWASFLFQSSRRMANESGATGLLPAWGMFAVSANPIALIGMMLACAAAAAPRAADNAARGRRFLKVALLVPLAFFLLAGLRTPLHYSWMGPPLLAGLALAAELIPREVGRRSRPVRLLDRAWAPAVALTMLVFGFALPYFTIGLPPLPAPEATNWRSAAGAVDQLEHDIQRRSGMAPLTIVMDSHAIVSLLAFYDPDRNFEDITNQHLFGLKGLMYAYWMTSADVTPGRPIVLIGDKPEDMRGPTVEGSLKAPEIIQQLPGGRLSASRRLYFRTAQSFHSVIAMVPSED